MIKEAIEKILSLAPPNISEHGDLEYTDKNLHLIYPPVPTVITCSTLQGLVDLIFEGFDDLKPEAVFLRVASPTEVELIQNAHDAYGHLRVWAMAKYPQIETFKFGVWHRPEAFVIALQQHFQRVKVETAAGDFAHDLDYVLGIASKITAEHTSENVDDGFAQRVAVKQGISLKAETVLKPMVNLAPYRTFAEIDQVLSQFVFRAKYEGESGSPLLALFEGDGGRWKLAAVAAIKAWLDGQQTKVPVIS
jgi:elongation factor P hydroxylase